HKLGSFVGLM
nr:neurokinin A [Beringraja rhina]